MVLQKNFTEKHDNAVCSKNQIDFEIIILNNYLYTVTAAVSIPDGKHFICYLLSVWSGFA